MPGSRGRVPAPCRAPQAPPCSLRPGRGHPCGSGLPPRRGNTGAQAPLLSATRSQLLRHGGIRQRVFALLFFFFFWWMDKMFLLWLSSRLNYFFFFIAGSSDRGKDATLALR